MKMKKTTITCLLAVLLLAFSGCQSTPQTSAPEVPAPRRLELVAHAGGTINGYVYTNSLEALQTSVQSGYRLIEIDFMPTSDGVIVLTHVWNNIPNRVPGATTQIVSHAEFMSYRLFNRYTPMDLSMLIAFLDEHPDIRIITDTKDGYDAYTALYVIAEQYPEHIHRFIAQAYRFEHVPRIRALGFEDVIVTLYLMPEEIFDHPEEIARLAHAHEVYAVTIQEYGILPDFAARLDVANIRFFAHTVNNPYRAAELLEMGFYGIYTNFLIHTADSDTPVPALAPQIDSQLARLEEGLARLDETEHTALAEVLIYQLDVPVYLHGGVPLPVSHTGRIVPYGNIDGGLVAPIAHYESGVVYLPLGNLLYGRGTYTWDGDSRTVSITLDTGETYELTEGFILYRSRIFLSSWEAVRVSRHQILRQGDFVIVTPDPAPLSEHTLFTLAETVFADVRPASRG